MSAPLRIRRLATKGVTGDSESLKPYLDRLLKLIPAEVVSLYLVGSGFIPATDIAVLTVWAVFCFLAVGFVKAYGTADRAAAISPDWVHVTLSMIAFVIWVYSLGGPFAHLSWYKAYLGSLLILAFTFAVPYFYRGPSAV